MRLASQLYKRVGEAAADAGLAAPVARADHHVEALLQLFAAIARCRPGSCWPSASMNTSMSPLAARAPRLIAAPLPIEYGEDRHGARRASRADVARCRRWSRRRRR